MRYKYEYNKYHKHIIHHIIFFFFFIILFTKTLFSFVKLNTSFSKYFTLVRSSTFALLAIGSLLELTRWPDTPPFPSFSPSFKNVWAFAERSEIVRIFNEAQSSEQK